MSSSEGLGFVQTSICYYGNWGWQEFLQISRSVGGISHQKVHLTWMALLFTHLFGPVVDGHVFLVFLIVFLSIVSSFQILSKIQIDCSQWRLSCVQHDLFKISFACCSTISLLNCETKTLENTQQNQKKTPFLIIWAHRNDGISLKKLHSSAQVGWKSW